MKPYRHSCMGFSMAKHLLGIRDMKRQVHLWLDLALNACLQETTDQFVAEHFHPR